MPSGVRNPNACPEHLTWHSTTVQGARAQYGEAGDGLPVLFLHGWALGQHAYKRALKRLVQQGCHVVAPAMPGFGGTPNLPTGQLSFAGYAEWVSEFLGAVDLDGPVLVIGHSFGGGVAVKLAYDHPDQVRQLVLVSSIGGPTWSSGGRRVRLMADRPLWDWGLKFPADLWPPSQMSRLLPVFFEDLVRNLTLNPIGMWRAGMLARSPDLSSEMAGIKARGLPVVALSGDHDKVIPKASFEALCDALGCAGEVVPGHHSWLLADPDAFGLALAVTVSNLQAGEAGAVPAPPPAA